jgi:hypothetical protein
MGSSIEKLFDFNVAIPTALQSNLFDLRQVGGPRPPTFPLSPPGPRD